MAALVVVFTVFILAKVLATHDGSANEKPYKPNHLHCIKMTPNAEAEIEFIIEKIGNFIHNLTEGFGHYDITHVHFEIEKHSDDEAEEKDTILQVSINDCAEVEDGETKNEKAKKKETKIEKDETKKETKEQKKVETESTVVESTAVPELYMLNLEKPGQELLKKLEKRQGQNPLLVYIQELLGRTEYVFPSQK